MSAGDLAWAVARAIELSQDDRDGRPIWTLSQALVVLERVTAAAQKGGYLLALYGSLLGESERGLDLDLLAVPSGGTAPSLPPRLLAGTFFSLSGGAAWLVSNACAPDGLTLGFVFELDDRRLVDLTVRG